jgi:hypothetical protein
MINLSDVFSKKTKINYNPMKNSVFTSTYSGVKLERSENSLGKIFTDRILKCLHSQPFTYKKIILIAIGICFSFMLQAQVSKPVDVTDGGHSAALKADKMNTVKNNNPNEKTPSNMNRQGIDPLMAERNFEATRIESEKQIRFEMENYRNEIMLRLINEEYYRLINDKTPVLQGNLPNRNTKLAKYKTLKELLQEQAGKRANPAAANPGQMNPPMTNPMELDGMMQQLDSKIREEEMHSEMLNRQRMEMQMRMEQEHQKQLPIENKN